MGSKKTKSTSKTQIPAWLEEGSQDAVAKARGISDRAYTPYPTESRFADKDYLEQGAEDTYVDRRDDYRQDFDDSRYLTERGSQSFLDADIGAYMNPYIEGALDPAARELREEQYRNEDRAGQKAAMQGAFGGSRGAILETEATEKGVQAIGDLYGEGYYRAFESAADQFNADRDAAFRGADQFRDMGQAEQRGLLLDVQQMRELGELNRGLEQADMNFDYQQFVEARDWDITNLQPLIAALSSVPHSTTSTTETKKSGGTLGKIVGIAATAAAAYFTAGASLAVQAAATAGTGAAAEAFTGE